MTQPKVPSQGTLAFMEKMKAQVEEIESQLVVWSDTISELVAQVEQIDENARLDYQLRIDDIKAKHADAQAKLDHFRRASAEKWEEFRLDVEKARDDLANALTKLLQN